MNHDVKNTYEITDTKNIPNIINASSTISGNVPKNIKMTFQEAIF
jgi:hypothetical protein